MPLSRRVAMYGPALDRIEHWQRAGRHLAIAGDLLRVPGRPDGLLMKVKLWGSDDDTTNRFLLRWEVGVDLKECRCRVPPAGRR